MGRGPMTDMLAQWPAGTSQAAVGREVLRVLATLAGDNSERAMAQACREVLAWAEKQVGQKLPEQAREGQHFEFQKDKHMVMGACIDEDDVRIWSLRCNAPDRTVLKRIWTTETTIVRQGDQPARLAVRLLAPSVQEKRAVTPQVPAFLRQIAARCGLTAGGVPVTAEPWQIRTDADAGNLITMLQSSARCLPVVVASGDERAADPSVPCLDVHALAQAMLGLAHVVVLPAVYSYWLTDRFGKTLSVYHGAVRVYFPGFGENAYPYLHPLYMRAKILTNPQKYFKELCHLLAEKSVQEIRFDDVPTFAAVRRAAPTPEKQPEDTAGADHENELAEALRKIKALQDKLESETAKSIRYRKNSAKHQARVK